MPTHCQDGQLKAINPSIIPVNSLNNFIKGAFEALELKATFVYVYENDVRPTFSHHADGYKS